MGRQKRLAPDSLRDTDWQAAEYERLMGAEARARQELGLKLSKGDCTCQRRTLRTAGHGYRTVHQRGCAKWKDWMATYVKEVNPAAAAHAAAARREQDAVAEGQDTQP